MKELIMNSPTALSMLSNPPAISNWQTVVGYGLFAGALITCTSISQGYSFNLNGSCGDIHIEINLDPGQKEEQDPDF